MNISYSLGSVTPGDLIAGVTFECKAFDGDDLGFANTKLLERTSHAARMEDACSIEGLADALEALTEARNEAVDEDVKPEGRS
jgi:hypothetical protein